MGTATKSHGSDGIPTPLRAQSQGKKSLVMSRIEINGFLEALFTFGPASQGLVDHTHEVICRGSGSVLSQGLLAKRNCFAVIPEICQPRRLIQERA